MNINQASDVVQLKRVFTNIMELRSNKNYTIDNIRFFEVEENDNLYAIGDVEFDWMLNGHIKHVSFSDFLFAKINNVWQICS